MTKFTNAFLYSGLPSIMRMFCILNERSNVQITVQQWNVNDREPGFRNVHRHTGHCGGETADHAGEKVANNVVIEQFVL